MPTFTHNTVPTQYVEAGGIRFAYRRFGMPAMTPLVFLQHFRGNMDNYDSAITDPLSTDREIVLFDNTGVGNTNGQAKRTVSDMARDAETFIEALGLREADLLGHSMGGEVAQMLALTRSALVRHLILVGTGPRGGEGMAALKPSTAELFTKTYDSQDEMWIPIFFSASEQSREAGRQFLTRIRARPDRDAIVSKETAEGHRAASAEWGQATQNRYEYLKDIVQPTLVVNGNDDVVIATVNSYILQQNMPNARLILYPDANHGSHFQYSEDFVAQVRLFLHSTEKIPTALH